MRVCFITFEYPPKVIGGLGTYADQLVKGLNNNGVDVYVITRGDVEAFQGRIFRIPIRDVPYWRRLFFIRSAIDLFFHLKDRLKFDLVHLNGAYPMVKRFGLPTLCTFHSSNVVQIKVVARSLRSIRSPEDIYDLVIKNPIGILSDTLSSRLVDGIICPSPSIATELRSHYFIDEEKLCIIPNGIDLEAFDKTKMVNPTLLNELEIEKDKFILFIGRLVFLKGAEYLIRAFEIARRECRGLKLVIVGSGPEELYLRNMAKKTQDVLFMGTVRSPEVKRFFYENCLAVLIPSIHETLPTVALEAMVYRKPIIATSVGGTPFLVKDEKNGFLIKPKDYENMANLIKVLYDNPELRAKMGKYGRRLVEEQFSSEKMARETIRIYRLILESEKRQNVNLDKFRR